jgi:hypothetical protein
MVINFNKSLNKGFRLITDEFLIGTIIIMFLVMLYWLHKGFQSNSKNNMNIKEAFLEEGEVNEGISEGNKGAEQTSEANQDPSLDKKMAECSPSDKLSDICINLDTCCQYDTNECFCKHPITNKCYSQYKECLKNLEKEQLLVDLYKKKGIDEICKVGLGECCNKFNDVKLDAQYELNDGSQTIVELKKFCGLGSKKNVKDVCQKMCSTFDGCKGYIADALGCALFDEIKYFQAAPGAVYGGVKAPQQKAINGFNPKQLMIKK